MKERALIQRGFQVALSLCHDRAEAKDLVQQAWMKLAGRYREINQRLLFRAIGNLWIDATRRPRLVLLDESGAVDRTAGDPGPGDGPTRDELLEALGTLRPEEREAIYLAVVEGYSTDEIADLTDRPRGTVLSLIRRGKQKLRHQLSDEPEVAAVTEGALP